MSQSNVNQEGLAERANKIEGWYHAIDLGDGVVTPGPFDMSKYLHHYDLPERMEGKRVLDVGCANGYFSIEFEKRGAAEVVAVDLASWIDADWPPRYRREYLASKSAEERNYIDEQTIRAPFDLVVEVLGQGRIRKEEMTVYEICPDRLGMFDYVFCGSMLMHVRDPVLAIQCMRSVCKPSGELLVAVSARKEDTSDAIAYFAGAPDMCNFWQLSGPCLTRILEASDFKVEGEGINFDVRDRSGEFLDTHFLCHARPVASVSPSG